MSNLLGDLERGPSDRARSVSGSEVEAWIILIAGAVLIVMSVVLASYGTTHSSSPAPAPATINLPPPDEPLALRTMLADPTAPHGQEFPVKVGSIAMAKPITLLISDDNGEWLKPLLGIMFHVSTDGGEKRFVNKKGQSINCKIDSAGKDFVCWFP